MSAFDLPTHQLADLYLNSSSFTHEDSHRWGHDPNDSIRQEAWVQEAGRRFDLASDQ